MGEGTGVGGGVLVSSQKATDSGSEKFFYHSGSNMQNGGVRRNGGLFYSISYRSNTNCEALSCSHLKALYLTLPVIIHIIYLAIQFWVISHDMSLRV